MNKLKFLVTSCSDDKCHHGPSYNEIAKITDLSKKEYAESHGYDFYSRKEIKLTERASNWERISIFLDYIDKYDWIFYTDCDSMIMNHTIKLENLIDDNFDIIISETERKNLIQTNTGVMLVKCSKWTKDFMNLLLTDKYKNYYHENMWEQGAINNEINTDAEIKKHFKITHLRFFNSYYHAWHPNDNYQHGDFVIHLPGRSNESRYQIFNELKNHIIKIPNYKIPFEP